MKRKSIKDVIHIYYGTQGASGLYIDEIYNALKSNFKQEIFVSFFFPFNYGKKIFFKYTDLASGIKNSKYRKYYRAFELVFGLVKCLIYIAKTNPKLVNYSLNSSFWTDIVFLKLIKKVSNSKIIITCHDVIPFSKDEGDKQNQIKHRRDIFAFADYLLVHNANSIKDLKDFYGIRENVIIFHPFPIMDLKKLDLNIINHEKEYDFAFIGHLRREKGIEILIRAWNIFIAKYSEAKLLIAGNLPKGINIEKLEEIKDKNVDLKLHFLTDNEYLNYIENSTTIVLPYIEGTNSGVIYNLVNLDVNIICSDLEMFTLNPLIDKAGVFEKENISDLVSKLELFYKRRKIESNNVEDYRNIFYKQTLEAYNKMLSKQHVV